VIEVERSNVANYAIFGFKGIALGPDAAFVSYENTMEFPHWAKMRFLRVYISELSMMRRGRWKMRHAQETPVKWAARLPPATEIGARKILQMRISC